MKIIGISLAVGAIMLIFGCIPYLPFSNTRGNIRTSSTLSRIAGTCFVAAGIVSLKSTSPSNGWLIVALLVLGLVLTLAGMFF